MGPDEVLKLVPQQPPFRFIDTIHELDREHIVASYRFPEDADFYRGHFPGNPITPGVILVEAMAQAAGVLATIKRDGIEAKGGTWMTEEEQAFKQPILDQYETQSHPYYASARLWDDGVIDPKDTRRVLGMGLEAALNAPIEKTTFGVFRM